MTEYIRGDYESPKEGGDISYMDMIDETEALGESQIAKVFAGTTVFLTGGTGSMGKLMIEKLMRSCPDIKRLYCLARPKKNKDVQQRMQEQFDDVLYSRLRKLRPDFVEKIAIIEGDVGQIGLGMSDKDRSRITKEVEIIFHGAATVRFDEQLKTAVEINVRGTREMLKLARMCTKLKAFTHVSTAYCNCVIQHIEEKFYDNTIPGDKLIDLAETLDENTIRNITPGLLGNYPNTYTFTKSAAEDIVVQYSKGLPVAVFRPSIIMGTSREPISGWIDNVYGATGVIVGAGVGLLHVLNCDPKAKADLVPGDMVVNACIATAWKTVTEYQSNHENSPPSDLPLPVYNYVSSAQNPLTWDVMMNLTETHGLQIPSLQSIYYYDFRLTTSLLKLNFYLIMMHWIPAYIADACAVLIGKKPMLKKAYTKIGKFSEVITYFSVNEWTFEDSNTRNLHNALCRADKELFHFNINDLDWNEYFYNYVRGIRVLLLKDPIETVPDGLKKQARLKVLHYVYMTMIVMLVGGIMWFLSKYLLSH